jgi:cell wall assembly regulator SMI1
LNEWLKRLELWLAGHRPRALVALLPGATRDELRQWERELGAAGSSALSELLAWHNGQDPRGPAFQHNRRLLGTGEILEDRAMLRELVAAGDITAWHDGYLPFLRSWGGDLVCVDTAGQLRGVPGEIFVRTSDDEVYSPDYPSLLNWLEVFVTTLEAGLWQGDGELQPRDDEAFLAAVDRIAPGYPISGDVE